MYDKLGDTIKHTRIERGYSKKQIADRVGVNFATYTKAEEGTGSIKFGSIVKICSVLGIDLFNEDLLNIEKVELPEPRTVTLNTMQGIVDKIRLDIATLQANSGGALTETYLLNHQDLIKPFNKDNLGSNTMDLTLGNHIGLENGKNVDITNGYDLEPGQFVLGYTNEIISIPSDAVGVVKGKSSRAREGLMIECAGLCDSGWSGQIVLEIKNLNQNTKIHLTPGMKICQILYLKNCGDVKNLYSAETGHHYQDQRAVTRSWEESKVTSKCKHIPVDYK